MTFEEIKQKEHLYYAKAFSRFDRCFVSGKGCELTDLEGRTYLDFFGGIAVNALGYADPELTGAIADQAAKLIHISNLFYSLPQTELCERLVKGSDFARVFFCNSGAEANEAAIKLCRKYFFDRGENRFRFLTADNSFHGRTLATATATGQPKYSRAFRPLPEGFTYLPYNDPAAMEEALQAPDVCAVLLETVQGEGGVLPADPAFLQKAAALCKKHGVFLILDEVQTGMGRCGTLFSYQQFGISPDVVTLAKGLAGGVPIGAMLCSKALEDTFGPGDHGSTFGGNPLACAAANVVVRRLTETDLLAHVQKAGAHLKARLKGLMDRHACLKAVRGLGLLVGAELDPSCPGREIVAAGLEHGLVLNCAGHNTLRFAPPLIVTEAQIDRMADILDQLLP